MTTRNFSSGLTPASPPASLPTISDIRDRTLQQFGKRPCLWQARVGEALLKGDKDIICIAGTGQGKTLGLWIPLLFRPQGILVIVVPLNLLGDQHVATLKKAGINAISINSETATNTNYQAIRDGAYRAVMINPEQLMKVGGEFEALLKIPDFAKRLIALVFDEAHCISAWGDFRPEYKDIGRLRYILPSHVPIMVTSATLPPLVLSDVQRTLQLTPHRTLTIRRTTDRPNIHISVRKIQSPLKSFADLAFLIPDGWKPDDPLPSKFLIFFDNINEATQAAEYLRGRLPPEYRHHITWFNSDMSVDFKTGEVTNLAVGVTWGSCTTDSFGMGFDLPDVLLVMQWRVTCTLSTLWQRFGRAARALNLTAHAILFAEKDYFDAERREKEKNRAKRVKKAGQQTAKRKRIADDADQIAKRPALGSESAAVPDAPALRTGNRHLAEQEMVYPDDVLPSGALAAAAFAVVEVEVEDDKAHADERHPVERAEGSENESADDLAERKRQYEQQAKPSKKTTKEIEMAMDDFINADERCLKCRRVPVKLYFDDAEGSASDHRACDSSVPDGCPRCYVPLPTICCDLHSPSAFAQFDTIVVKPYRAPNRSSLAKFDMTPNDAALLNALDDWRDDKAIELFGRALLTDYGPGLIMSDGTLNRIVACAHYSKIQEVSDLERETHWNRAAEFFDEIIDIIRRYRPTPPAPSAAPLRDVAVGPNGAPAAVKSTRAKPKCSACGIPGHNARNRICEKHPSRQTSSSTSKENSASRQLC